MKNVFVVILAFLMLFTVFACNKDTNVDVNQGEDPGQDLSDSIVENTPEPTPPPLVPDTDIDLNGRNVRITAWWDESLGSRGVSESRDLNIDRKELLEQKYNFAFEYINLPSNEVFTLMQSSIMAGDGASDIFYIQMQMLIPFVSNHLLYPLSDLDELDIYNDQRWNKSVREYTTLSGKVYGMSTNKSNMRGVVFFNERLLEQSNIENLFDLQKNKQWTWDKMREIAEKLTKDNDNDGVTDQYGLTSQDFRIDLAAAHSNGGGFIIYENGNFSYGLDDSRTLEALNFVQDLRHKQKVCQVPDESYQWDITYSDFENGKVPMLVGEYWANSRIRETLDEPFGVVAFPIGPQMSNYVSVGGDETYTVMASDLKNASEIAHIWKIYTDPLPIEEDEVDLNTLGHPRNLETYEMMKESGSLIINPAMLVTDFYNNNFWPITSELKSNSKTPKNVADEYRDMANGYINDVQTMLEGLNK